jgi:hypothetical protein
MVTVAFGLALRWDFVVGFKLPLTLPVDFFLELRDAALNFAAFFPLFFLKKSSASSFVENPLNMAPVNPLT